MNSVEYDLLGCGIAPIDYSLILGRSIPVADIAVVQSGFRSTETTAPRLPALPLKDLRYFTVLGGGSIANAVCNAANMDPELRTAMVGKVGDDWAGHVIIEDLKRFGVDSRYLRTTPETRSIARLLFYWPSLTDAKEMDVFSSTEPGFDDPCKAIRNLYVHDAALPFPSSAIFACNKPNKLVFQLSDLARVTSVNLFTFRAPRWDSCRELLSRCHLLVCNRKIAASIARAFSQSPNGVEMDDQLCAELAIARENRDSEAVSRTLLKVLLQTFEQLDLAIITHGARGLYYLQRGMSGPARIPAFGVENVVDPTGAGDAFHGTLLCRLLQRGIGKSEGYRISHLRPTALQEDLRFAAGVAALVCERPGPRNLPGRREAIDRIGRFALNG